MSGVEEKKDNKKFKKATEDTINEKEPLTFDLNDIETLERNCEIRNLTECVDILVKLYFIKIKLEFLKKCQLRFSR